MCTEAARLRVDEHLVLLIEAVDRVTKEVICPDKELCEPAADNLISTMVECRTQLMTAREGIGTATPGSNLEESLSSFLEALGELK